MTLFVCKAGHEEGWYDLRGKSGEIIESAEGVASVLLSLSCVPTKEMPHNIQGFMLSKGATNDSRPRCSLFESNSMQPHTSLPCGRGRG